MLNNIYGRLLKNEQKILVIKRNFSSFSTRSFFLKMSIIKFVEYEKIIKRNMKATGANIAKISHSVLPKTQISSMIALKKNDIYNLKRSFTHTNSFLK